MKGKGRPFILLISVNAPTLLDRHPVLTGLILQLAGMCRSASDSDPELNQLCDPSHWMKGDQWHDSRNLAGTPIEKEIN